MPEGIAIIDYTNWKGQRRSRLIHPIEIWWGGSPYHSGFQYFLKAVDCETGDIRDFAMGDIHGWANAN